MTLLIVGILGVSAVAFGRSLAKSGRPEYVRIIDTIVKLILAIIIIYLIAVCFSIVADMSGLSIPFVDKIIEILSNLF